MSLVCPKCGRHGAGPFCAADGSPLVEQGVMEAPTAVNPSVGQLPRGLTQLAGAQPAAPKQNRGLLVGLVVAVLALGATLVVILPGEGGEAPAEEPATAAPMAPARAPGPAVEAAEPPAEAPAAAPVEAAAKQGGAEVGEPKPAAAEPEAIKWDLEPPRPYRLDGLPVRL